MLWLWILIREGVRYLIVVLAALATASLFIWYLFPSTGRECTDCAMSGPTLRAECDKQFSGKLGAKQLDVGAEDEWLIAYVDHDTVDHNASGGYPTVTAPALRGPGYVMVRVQPQFGYDSAGGRSQTYDTSSTSPETPWQEVTVAVVKYINPLRNDPACPQSADRFGAQSVRFRAGQFESYCEFQHRSGQADAGQGSYRIFVRNESKARVEYCIISNCDSSAPYGQGTLCMTEQVPDAAEPHALLPPRDGDGTSRPAAAVAPATAPAARPPETSKIVPPAAASKIPSATVPVRPAAPMEKPPLPELDQPMR